MGTPKTGHVLIEDYVAAERADGCRYEYAEGLLYNMAGATLSHTRICTNLNRVLANALIDRGTCESFTSDLKVEVDKGKRYVYPDATVACPKAKESDVVTGAIVNPRVIFEVLSKGTANYDLTVKLRFYSSVSTVREYVLVSQEEPRVTIYRRKSANDSFVVEIVYGLEQEVVLQSIGVRLLVADLFLNVALTGEGAGAGEE